MEQNLNTEMCLQVWFVLKKLLLVNKTIEKSYHNVVDKKEEH